MDFEINKNFTISLPNEIFEEILSYIAFHHLQKVCILVCKRWFDFIRNSAKLSECVNFSFGTNDANSIPNLNKRLKNWPKVKNLGLNLDTWVKRTGPSNDIFFDGLMTELFEKNSPECLDSKRIRFNTNRDIFAFLWPSSLPSISKEFLNTIIFDPVEAKSSILNTRSISEVTGNNEVLVYFKGFRV